MLPLTKEAAAARFSLLGLAPAFALDVQALEAAYFKAQRLHHPDRSVGKPPAERQQAMQRSVDINEAYAALKEPLSRAQTLLAMQGIAVGTDADTAKPAQNLLVETMEWREAIDEANAPEALKTLEASLNKALSDCIGALGALYEGQDWQGMAQSALRLGYIEKSLLAVMQKRKRLQTA